MCSSDLLVTGSPLAAGAKVVVQATETVAGVIATSGGSLDLTDLSPLYNDKNFIRGFINAANGTYGGTARYFTSLVTVYGGPSFAGPRSFGTKGPFAAISIVGDSPGINGGRLGQKGGVLVDASYISGNALSGTSTYSGQTFLSMGLTPGEYEWTWGVNNRDSYKLIIGSTPVPGPCLFWGSPQPSSSAAS